MPTVYGQTPLAHSLRLAVTISCWVLSLRERGETGQRPVIAMLDGFPCLTQASTVGLLACDKDFSGQKAPSESSQITRSPQRSTCDQGLAFRGWVDKVR